MEPEGQTVIEEEDEKFCFCHQHHEGRMIACDNPKVFKHIQILVSR